MAAPSSVKTSDSAPGFPTVKDDCGHEKPTASVSREKQETERHENSPANHDEAIATKEKRKGMFASYQHSACLRRIQFASQHHPSVKFLLEAINKLGSEFVIDKQVSCERCTDDNNVGGGFDPTRNEVIVCENRSPTQRMTSMLLTHELVHAYDHSKAKVDWTDLRAVACSEIRAANLSGDCSFLSEKVYRWNIGAKNTRKACVKRLALSSILATRDVPREEAETVIDSVWESCFHDYAPFADIPRSAADRTFSRFSEYYDPR